MAKQKYWDGTKWVQVAPSMKEFNEHKAEKVHQGEVHGLRTNTKKELEFFDGVKWNKAYYKAFDDNSGSPGSPYLIAGDEGAGFFGEVPATDLITGSELSSELGLTQGNLQFSDEPWLKFYYENKIQFVAKKPIRYSLPWDSIDQVGAVKGTIITIGNKEYKVRLLKGANQDLTTIYEGSVLHNSEWNRLMIQIHEESIDKVWGSPNNVESDIGSWNHSLGSGKQGMYNDIDLDLTGSGRETLCQEIIDGTDILTRGRDGVTNSRKRSKNYAFGYNGFRPVLELIQ